MDIREGDLDDSRVIALLQTHLRTARAATAPGSAHALDLTGLRAPGITLWAAWDGDALLGTAALKILPDEAGEVKSMHTAEAARRQGVGKALLAHVVTAARVLGLKRLYLETGSWPYFHPAHALYLGAGFEECGPFHGYAADPNSRFFRLVP